ncbi:MAG: hypothetical protein AB7V13_11660 [Pseudorhodoplanes sp.]|uniref:hypothetical protein n=1 Tax=Pseudorhodoplanes sp. TaxID=1934341 RepID=UPI003D10B0DE
MARTAKPTGSQDLIGRLSDTIASHPQLSAAAAFQMGVMLGQVMQSSGALKGIGRKMAAAPGAIAASIPTFGLFDGNGNASGRHTTAASRSAAKRTGGGRRKRKSAARRAG